jgi:phosphatidylglycerol:prolipoprotein diacylglycerol transferase
MIDGVPCHPTFLYESIWCLLLFVFLLWLDNRRKFEGQIFLLYGILYSVERFFVEALRTDSLMIGPFKQAQVLSLTVIVVCAAAYVILNRRRNAKAVK